MLRARRIGDLRREGREDDNRRKKKIVGKRRRKGRKKGFMVSIGIRVMVLGCF